MTNLELMMLLGDHEPDLLMALETPHGYLVPLAVETRLLKDQLRCLIRTVPTSPERPTDGP